MKKNKKEDLIIEEISEETNLIQENSKIKYNIGLVKSHFNYSEQFVAVLSKINAEIGDNLNITTSQFIKLFQFLINLHQNKTGFYTLLKEDFIKIMGCLDNGN